MRELANRLRRLEQKHPLERPRLDDAIPAREVLARIVEDLARMSPEERGEYIRARSSRERESSPARDALLARIETIVARREAMEARERS
jgi:hypothetical protein